jgi:hypothetical protein
MLDAVHQLRFFHEFAVISDIPNFFHSNRNAVPCAFGNIAKRSTFA